jgi:hypothetical protein
MLLMAAEGSDPARVPYLLAQIEVLAGLAKTLDSNIAWLLLRLLLAEDLWLRFVQGKSAAAAAAGNQGGTLLQVWEGQGFVCSSSSGMYIQQIKPFTCFQQSCIQQINSLRCSASHHAMHLACTMVASLHVDATQPAEQVRRPLQTAPCLCTQPPSCRTWKQQPPCCPPQHLPLAAALVAAAAAAPQPPAQQG